MSTRSRRRRPARPAGPPRSTDVTTTLKGFEEAPALAPHQPCHGGAPPIPVASSTSATWARAATAQIVSSTARHGNSLFTKTSWNLNLHRYGRRCIGSGLENHKVAPRGAFLHPDDLANRADRIDDGAAGGIRHEPRQWLDRARPVGPRREREDVRLLWR